MDDPNQLTPAALAGDAPIPKSADPTFSRSTVLSAEEIAAQQVIEDTMIKLRAERDVLLSSSDKYLMVDYPIEQDLRDKWFIYRQVLRDLPVMSSPDLDEDGNLIGVEWPVVPSS